MRESISLSKFRFAAILVKRPRTAIGADITEFCPPSWQEPSLFRSHVELALFLARLTVSIQPSRPTGRCT